VTSPTAGLLLNARSAVGDVTRRYATVTTWWWLFPAKRRRAPG
jgi:hypothetical protein